MLLKASLLDGDVARSAWENWRARVTLDDVDHASARMIPLLLANLQRMNVVDPELPRYQNVARHTWLENQLLAKHGGGLLRIFADAGIPAMVLKGLAIAPLYYGNFRLRAMSDVDILVPVAQAREAACLLNAKGWHAQRQTRMKTRDYLTTQHSMLFTNANDVQFDLHWHVLNEACWHNADDIFWQGAQPMTFHGVQAATLCATDHLFQACAHGGRANLVAPFRWVADSAMILRAASIDWDRLLRLATDFRLTLRLCRTLGYLRDAMELPVPDDILAQLVAIPATHLEAFEDKLSPPSAAQLRGMLVMRYVHYRRSWASRGRLGFLRYLQASYGSLYDVVGTWRQARRKD